MTKLKGWICDICKREFREDDNENYSNVAFEIIIPSGNKNEIDAHFKFDDTCSNCRMELANAIVRLIH